MAMIAATSSMVGAGFIACSSNNATAMRKPTPDGRPKELVQVYR